MRYHIVSIAAVFLALALGVVLGSTGISDRLLAGLSSDKVSLGRQVGDLQTQRAALSDQVRAGDQFAAATGPAAVRGALQGRTVLVVTTADADPSDRDALTRLVGAAGGVVTSELQLTEAFTDPAKSDQLRELTLRLLPAGVQLPTESDPGTLAGGLLGALLLGGPTSGAARANPEEAAAVFAGLREGGFVRVASDMRPAQLAIVLTGARPAGGDLSDRAGTVARFAAQLDSAGGGAVLAGRAGSADESGPLGVVRSDRGATARLSTVDNVANPAGRVVTVFALREQAEGRAGQYGTAPSATGMLPGATG